MNYLFFDIECCNSHNICEFGYVLTDDKFNIIKQEELLINPAKEFKIKTDESKFIDLTYNVEEYMKSPSFREYYEKIKDVITKDEQLVFGYAINNDAYYLKTACQRYHLTPISFTFYDIQIIFSKYYEVKEQLSLKKATSDLNLDLNCVFHRAIDDSIATLNVAKKLVLESKLKLEELVKKYECCKGKCNKNYIFNCEKEKEKQEKYELNELRKKLNSGRLNYTIGDIFKDFKK